MDKLVRNSGETREKVIELISVILKSNIKRSGMQVDMNTVSSDRFLNNINQLLLKFSQPFLDPQHSKIQRIDMNYYLRTSRADIEDEARIGATKDEFKVYLQDRDLSGVNFISDVFHLNVLCFHLGLLKCISYYQNVYEKLEHMEEELEKLESGRGGLNNPAMGNFNEMILKRFRAKVEETKALKFALEAYLLDHDLLRNVYSFYQLLIAFLLRCLDPTHAYPFNQFQLPIYQPGGKPMDMFRMLPEYYIYDILEFLVFIAKFCPDVLLGQSTQEIVIFITTLLYHQDAINNPYLKIKMVEILYYFTFPLRERGAPEGILGPAMNSNPIALNHLLKSLLKFYVQVEQTGLSSQFHDKFNVRYNISQLLKLLWKHPNHQQQLRSLSQDMNFFVRFVNLLMNDTTYLLDESISKLTEIHDIQTEMEDTITWNNQTQEYRAEREKLLATDERMAKSYVGLSNKNVNLLNYVTEFIPTPFLSPEIVTRLAAMLNYTLTSLVGPKCSQLKVKNAKEYGFQPRALLSQLLMIFVHLKSKDFVSALAEDGRSYSNELYQRAINVVTKHGLLEHSQIQEFKNIMVQVEKEAKSNIEQAIDDIPEEYLDPLMFTMMKEPVLLPSSGMIVDLATIKAHLLSDSTDPFNRQALSIEQVVPQPELKEKIAQFIISKK
ncbi:U-box-domain-containing protein [Neoconidiobolus thromboides FSU 785]|nr:U-box-domain-containing protein [Neoconidiobolus thromboides FSU 785]